MWEYIVLGQVPGTQFQISFELYLVLMAGLVLLTLYIRWRKLLRQRWLLLRISLTIRLQNPHLPTLPSAA